MDPKKKFFFKTPLKNETLAVKVEGKNHKSHGKLVSFSQKRWVGLAQTLALSLLFVLTLFLLYPFFGKEDQFNVFSAPLLPFLAQMISPFLPYPYAIRLWLLAFLAFSPFSFYLFARELSGRKMIAFLASLLTLLPIGFFLQARVNMGLLGEDGAHIASLTFIPLICLLLLRFLRRGGYKSGIFAALGFTLVALTSPLGLFTLFCFSLVIVFSEILLGEGRLKILRFLMVLLLSGGFSAFWYNPKFLLLTIYSPQGRLVKETLSQLFPLSFFVLPILGTFGYLLFENRSHLQPIFIAIFWTFVFSLLSLEVGVSVSSPSRFQAGLGLAVAFLAGIVIVSLFDFMRLSSLLEKIQVFKKSKEFISFAILSCIFGSILLLIILGAKEIQPDYFSVLGFVSPENTAGIWEIRQKTSPLENILGYGITGLTLSFVGFIKLRLKRGNHA